MTPYGKTAQHAISAVSMLAQAYPEGKKLSSIEIAEARGLPKPVVAKVLTILSQAGIVRGSPGPGGGYSLAKEPHKISLADVAECFDRQEEALSCPFGPKHCGTGSPCPLHNHLSTIRKELLDFLKSNTFAVFVSSKSDKKKAKMKKIFSLQLPGSVLMTH
jgi:Rrf2 family protein